jgi:hypothetical protein
MDEVPPETKAHEPQLLCLREKTPPVMPAQANIDRDLFVP